MTNPLLSKTQHLNSGIHILYTIIAIMVLLTSCDSGGKIKSDTYNKRLAVDSNTQRIKLVRAYEDYYNYDSIKINIVDFAENYINDMYEKSVKERDEKWVSNYRRSNIDLHVKRSLTKNDLVAFPPEVIGVQKMNEQQYKLYLLYPYKRMTMKIQSLEIGVDTLNNFYLIDPLNSSLLNHKKIVKDQITIFYPENHEVDADAEAEVVKFNKELSMYFGADALPITVIVCDNKTEIYRTLGYEYYYYKVDDVQIGGLAFPHELIIWSGNGTPLYRHEMVHLYTYTYKPHHWLDEGIATYLGGHGQRSFHQLMCHIKETNQSFIFTDVFKAKPVLSESDNKYTLGSLIVYVILEKYGGFEKLKEIMKRAKTDKELESELNDLFQINENTLDKFLYKELEALSMKKNVNHVISLN